jgi:hypothetical protein
MSTKQRFFFALLLLTLTGFSQTKTIYHKSHNGESANFDPGNPGNFGMVDPRYMIDLIEKINDSTVVHYQTFSGTNREKQPRDTIQNDDRWTGKHVNLDSLQKRYPAAEFIGFETEKEGDSFFRKTTRKNNFLPILVMIIGIGGLIYGRSIYRRQLTGS